MLVARKRTSLCAVSEMVERSAELDFPASICTDAHKVHVSKNSSALRDANKMQRKVVLMPSKRTDTLQDLDLQTGQNGCIEYHQNARAGFSCATSQRYDMEGKRDFLFHMRSCLRTAIDANHIVLARIFAIFINANSLAKSIELEKKLRQDHETCISKDELHQLRPAFRY